jgi:F420-dependent oxidoreductase-like protein
MGRAARALMPDVEEITMRVNLMIEGQQGVSWEQWTVLARACEDEGLEGLFRSDHYRAIGSAEPQDSLDALTATAGLAALTKRVRLGTLVSPVTFRHPAVLAKSAVTIDHISGGRFELGIGAGWFEEEHKTHGLDFPANTERMEMLEEQIEIVHRQWHEGAFSFAGRHYRVENSDARPKPVQRPHVPLIVGGAAGRRSASLAARWADEYNTVFATPEQCRTRRGVLDRACETVGRDPSTLRFSLMTGIVVGTAEADVLRAARRVMARQGEGGDAKAWLSSLSDVWVVGTVAQVVDRLVLLEEAGVERVMLQHLAHTDVETIEVLGREVRPRVETSHAGRVG